MPFNAEEPFQIFKMSVFVCVCVCVCVHVSGVCDDREAEGNIKQSIRTVYMKVQTVAFKP